MNRLPQAIVLLEHDERLAFANTAAQGYFQPEQLRIGHTLPAHDELHLRSFVRMLFEDDGLPLERTVEAHARTFRLVGIPPDERSLATLMIEDVTENVRRDRARREFVANAAHELLTPLTGVVAAAHALAAGAKDVPDMRDRFIRHIERDCNRLARTARSLLTLARVQASDEALRPEVVDLRGLLEEVVEPIPDAQVAAIECPDAAAVLVDRDLAETALSNLISNGVRHSRDGNISISVECDEETVSVVVTSVDPGVDMRRLERPHRRFVGVGRDGGGFGLGVSIAAQALEMLGGSVLYDFDGVSVRVRAVLPAAP